MKTSLVIGGSGAVGGAVVRALAARGDTVTFTWCQREDRARALSEATGARGARLDLTDRTAAEAFFRASAAEPPSLVVYAAGVTRSAPLGELTDVDWDRASAVHGWGPFALCRALLPAMGARGGGDIVFVGALDGGQTLPLPVHFAATQGSLPALTMAVAKEAGPLGVRVNLVAVGPLSEGLSRGLEARTVEDYKSFSALRRLGTPDEVAAVVRWLATDNTFMTGRVVRCNGGI